IHAHTNKFYSLSLHDALPILMAFVDPVAESDQSMEAMMDGMADGRASALAPLLAAWGVSYDPERVVLDSRLGMSVGRGQGQLPADRKSTRLNSSHVKNSYVVF